MGGLGNQMFQYAVGRRVSLLRNTNLKMDESFLNDEKLNHTPRKFALDIFSEEIEIVTDAELIKFTSIQKSKFKRDVQSKFPFAFPYLTITEPTHNFNESILSSPENSHLIGFWQTEKYFLPIQDTIRKDFTFKKPLEGLNKNLADKMFSCNSVSIHVRRGDYINNPTTNLFHGICSPEYYYAGLDLIKKKVNDIHLFVFSDDMEWVKASMKFDIPVTYIDNNVGNNSYIDMQLMSLCKHNIIANSSFSWWGAWLNNNPGKILVAPKLWFSDTSINVSDVIPEGWNKL